MNILNKLTVRNLKLNKTRTLVAMLGIILATTLISITVGLGCSLYDTLIKHEIEDSGDYHVIYYNLTSAQKNKIVNNKIVDKFYTTNSVGYAKVNIKNKNRNVVHFIEYNKESFKNNNIRIVEGRYPENSNEVVLEKKMLNFGFDKRIGDEITFNVYGDREYLDFDSYQFDDLTDLSADSEMLEEMILDDYEVKTYKIVGIISDVGYGLEEKNSFLALSYNDNVLEPSEIYVKYNKPTKAVNYLCEEITNNNTDKDKCISNNGEFSSNEIEGEINGNLLFLYGVGIDKKTLTTILIIVISILSIISVSCIIIIKNSFSISVNERYKQYGMYSSIGATTKQLKKNVLFEGFIEGIIAIPLGIILGCIVVGALVFVTNHILTNDGLLTEIYYSKSLYFSFPLIGCLIIIFVSSLTVYFSCLFPAIKISKVSPIEAIRNSNEIKIKKRKLKSSKLIKKIFGIGGVLADKNIKRNRKKYRTIVISLTISVILFIYISAGMNQLKEELKSMKNTINYNYIFSLVDEKEYEDDYEYTKEDEQIFEESLPKIFEEVAQKADLEKYAYSYENKVFLDLSNFTDEYIKRNYGDYYNSYAMENGDSITILAVNDNEFKRMSSKYSFTQEDMDNGILVYNKYFVEYEPDKYKGYDNALDLDSIDELHVSYYVDDELSSDKIEKRIKLKVLGEANLDNALFNDMQEVTIIVNINFKKNHEEMFEGTNVSQLYIYDEDSEKVIQILENYDTEYRHYLFDINSEMQSIKNIILIMGIFMYTFVVIIVLIAVTNIFNTISTSMMLRKKEFAVLRSMGMTDKEFNRMIILESILYSFKALMYGLILSLMLLYAMFSSEYQGTFVENLKILFDKLPFLNILLTIIFVTIIILITMFYSISKINKQNIIETIRNDNI